MNTLSDRDKAYIAFLTGNRCRAYAWNLLSIYGVGKVYGGTGAPTHLSPEEQDEHLEMWEMQYQNPRWKVTRDRIVKDRKCCSRCKSHDSLEVHHKVYIADKMLWEYQDHQLEVLCRTCHLKEHGLNILPSGAIGRA